MPYPRLEDDGRTVTLDVHGTTVEEAVRVVRATLREAVRRGRDRVRVIHGSSTSSALYRNRTIRHALYELLDAGALDAHVTSAWRTDDYLLLSLDVTVAPDPTRLTLRNVLP
ncbi:Smr/MutS family protein [Rhodocaloribacter sp.]